MDFFDEFKEKLAEGAGKAGEVKDQLTGKAVEDRLSEFTELYSEVLIGMDNEMENLKEKVEKLEKAETVESSSLISFPLIISLLALLISVISLIA